MAVTRDEHMAFCKKRALQYLDAGDLPGAAASMASDLMKHRETIPPAEVMFLGALEAQSGDPDRVRRWIEGFA